MITWAALGAALLLLPAANPAAGRLRWLAATARSNPPVAAPRSEASAVRRRTLAALAGLPWPVTAAVVAVVAAAGVLAGGLSYPVLSVPAAVAGWTLGWCWHLLAVERAADADRSAVAAALGALADEYAAGAGLGAAFRSAAPAAGRFCSALAEAAVLAEVGAEPQQTLGREPMLAPLAVACALAARSGASMSALLAGVRADLAADRDTRAAVRAAVAGPRASALLLTGLPALGLLLGTALGADPARVLLRTPAGAGALTAGVLLDLLGLVWTMLLTRQRP
ncbi:MAG TPA: type II secretion system F family protein [Jatrophihabitans sp.]|nr:type II secretion system F family protein [Jatrophihabitans sp.]